MTVRIPIKDGKLVFPLRPLSDEELDAAEALIAAHPELKPERVDVEATWTPFERRAVRWVAEQTQQWLQDNARRKGHDAADRP